MKNGTCGEFSRSIQMRGVVGDGRVTRVASDEMRNARRVTRDALCIVSEDSPLSARSRLLLIDYF